MKKTLRNLAVIALALICAAAQAAGTAANPVVVHVRVDASGAGMVVFDRVLTSSPGCITSSFNNALAFDMSTNAGKAVMALALTAWISSKPLAAVYGKATCSIYGGSVEDWDYGL